MIIMHYLVSQTKFTTQALCGRPDAPAAPTCLRTLGEQGARPG
jgi:hypothetical protein